MLQAYSQHLQIVQWQTLLGTHKVREHATCLQLLPICKRLYDLQASL
jgi:hypothetical protein